MRLLSDNLVCWMMRLCVLWQVCCGWLWYFDILIFYFAIKCYCWSRPKIQFSGISGGLWVYLWISEFIKSKMSIAFEVIPIWYNKWYSSKTNAVDILVEYFLLFRLYNLNLRCYMVLEIKTGKFEFLRKDGILYMKI